MSEKLSETLYSIDPELERMYLEANYFDVNPETQEFIPVSMDVDLARLYDKCCEDS